MAIKSQKSNIVIAFIILLSIVAVVSIMGFFSFGGEKEIIQGQAEAEEYRVSTKVPSRIVKFCVEEGDHVNKGDTLVILDSPELRAKLLQATSARRAALAQEAKARRGAREEQLRGAKEMWEKAKAGLAISEKSYRRINRLYEEGVMSEQKRDEVKAKYDAMKATEAAARAQYDMAVNGARSEDREAASAQVGMAEGAVDEVESYMSETILTAPASGEITEIFPRQGELIGTGAPIMNVSRLDKMWITFAVREDYLRNFEIGKEIEAYIPAFDKDMKFRVSFIKDMGTYAAWKATKPTGDYDLKTFEVKAVPTQGRDGLRPGMSAVLER